MSKKISYQKIDENKKEVNQKSEKKEKENTFLLDVQLLSSLKSIPGKIIPLSNIMKTNEEFNINNKENGNDKKGIIANKSIFTPIDIKSNNLNRGNSGGTNDINGPSGIINNNINNFNNININNIYTTNNNFIFPNGNESNTNINININNFNNISNDIGINCGFLDNPLLCSPPSNHQSFLSIKSDNKNNNFLWTDNKFSQNSYYFPGFMMHNSRSGNLNYISNENNMNNGNYNKTILKLNQLNIHQSGNISNGNEELLKKKTSNPIPLSKNNEINIENNNNSDKKINLLYDYDKINEIPKKDENINFMNNIIQIDEEEEKGKNKGKKIFFNVENYSDESYIDEDDNIYSGKSNIKSDNSNIFNCYQKKKKRRKSNKEIKKFKCVHPFCEYSYKTLKQLQNHHYKMTSECQLDSVYILKLIKNTKVILINIIKDDNDKKEYFRKIYDTNINKITLNNYLEYIAGIHFDDKA